MRIRTIIIALVIFALIIGVYYAIRDDGEEQQVPSPGTPSSERTPTPSESGSSVEVDTTDIDLQDSGTLISSSVIEESDDVALDDLY